MTPRESGVLLVFAPGDSLEEYAGRIGRLRWARCLGTRETPTPAPDAPAGSFFAKGGVAVVVRDEDAIPAPIGDVRRLFAGRIVPAYPLGVGDVPPVHTLRELEVAGFPAGSAEQADRSRVPAVGFDLGRFPPAERETWRAFTERLFAESHRGAFDPSFRALLCDEAVEHDRPELRALLASRARRICDVGCGSGAVGAALRRDRRDARVTGIEKNPRAASLARGRLDRVLEEDAIAALERLAEEQECFDAFVFADVLEHLADPIRALALSRRCAAADASLVASVPNVGHLSLVRDLALGRFDPLPAGLTDVGHLRWFDRRFLGEALEEAGWRVDRIEGLPGAAPPDAEPFLSRLGDWPGLDRSSLLTYQWIAVATAAAEGTTPS